jgi:hypothetical protein
MLSAMSHTTTSPFPRSNPGAIMPIDQASSGTTYHTNHRLLLAVVRDVLLDMMRSAHGLHGIGKVGFGTCAGLSALWAAYPVDGWGRCCTHRLLASEPGVDVAAPPSVADPATTEVHHHPGVAR